MHLTPTSSPATIPPDAVSSPIDAFLAAAGLPPGRVGVQSGLISRRCASDGPSGAGVALGEEGGAEGLAEGPRTPSVWVPGEGSSSLIHEEKTGSPWDTTTYEPISQRVERYGNHRNRSLEMADFCESEQPHRATKLRECGAFLQFRDYFTLGEIRLTGGHFCQQDRLCGLCAVRRAGRYLRAYTEKVQAVTHQEKQLQPYLVTLTVKDGEDLGERVGHLLKSHRKLMDHRRQAKKDQAKGHRTPDSAACCAAGGVGSCEVKRGKGSGLWHPHWHAIWLCAEAPDLDVLKAEWFSITRDSFIVDARPFHFTQTSHDPGDGATWEEMVGDFCEVFKYALKLGDLSLADNWGAFFQLQRKRLIEPFGVLRGVEIPEDLRDAPLAPDLPFIEILLKHRRGRYQEVGYTKHDFDPLKMCRWPRSFSV